MHSGSTRRAVVLAALALLGAIGGAALAAATATSGGEENARTESGTFAQIELGGMQIYTAPHSSTGSFDTREQFLATINNSSAQFRERITPTDSVAKGDYVVVRVDVIEIFDTVRTRHDLRGVTATGGASGVSLRVHPVNNESGVVDYSARNNVLLTDPDNDTMYLVLNTDGEQFRVDTAYRAVFEVNESSPYIENVSATETERETVSTTFTVVEPSATFANRTADGTLELPAESNVTLEGETTLAPGTELEVRLGNDSFMTGNAVTVTDDGRFEITLDLSALPPGAAMTVTVHHEGRQIAETDGRIVEQVAGTTTAANTTTETITTTTETTETATTVDEPTETTTTEMTETTTTETTETATTEMTETTTTETTETATTVDEPTETTEPATATTTETGGQPGFGLSVALVAALAAALLVARRSA